MFCENCLRPVTPKDPYGGKHCRSCGTVGGLLISADVRNQLRRGVLEEAAQRCEQIGQQQGAAEIRKMLTEEDGTNTSGGVFDPESSLGRL